MAITLTIRTRDAQARPLPVRCRVQVKRGNQLEVDRHVGPGGELPPLGGLDGLSTYTVTVFDAGSFGDTGTIVLAANRDETREVHCLVKAKRATPVLPPYSALPKDLTDVIERSTELDLPRKAHALGWRAVDARAIDEREVGHDRELPDRAAPEVRAGEKRWNALNAEGQAGLLNLFAKMRSVTLSTAQRPVWKYVKQIRSIAPDRIKVFVEPTLKTETNNSSAFDKPLDVPIFHKPDKGFARAGTFKTKERFGNLQLTFSVSQEDAAVVCVDADVDDAAGIGHAEQVIRNESRALFKKIFGFLIPGLPNGISHPYDIHQIVVLNQRPREVGHPVAGVGTYEPVYRLRVEGIPPPYDV